jgi:hypothetical protein
MIEKEQHQTQFEFTGQVDSPDGSDCSHPVDHKPAFVKPSLICHGSVVDLTGQFGGSITPDDAESPYVN